MSKGKEAAIEALNDNPGAESVYYTEDANAWLPRYKSLAFDHARKAGLAAPKELQRSELEKPKSRKQVAEPDIETVEKKAAKKKTTKGGK